jgi:hypothetical protein
MRRIPRPKEIRDLLPQRVFSPEIGDALRWVNTSECQQWISTPLRPLFEAPQRQIVNQ